jgi:hypothetical protein
MSILATIILSIAGTVLGVIVLSVLSYVFFFYP